MSFLLTNIFSSRRRRSIHGQTFSPRAVRLSNVQLYRDLAQASGGQAIEVRKSDLSLATTVIKDSSAGAVVTLSINRNYLTCLQIVKDYILISWGQIFNRFSFKIAFSLELLFLCLSGDSFPGSNGSGAT